MKLPEKVKELMSPDRVILVATSDLKGIPHMAAAKGIVFTEEGQVIFENWFCIQTLKNILENPRIALSMFEPLGERGVQLLGVVEQDVPTEMLDGCSVGEENQPSHIPQAKHRLQIRVENILELSTGPHSDEESSLD
jgi:hypothetical protein